MVAYSDLWALSIPPIIMQAAAFAYALKLRKLLGTKNTRDLAGINGLLLASNIMLSFLIATAAGNSGQQPIEAYGLFIAFALPMALATLLLVFQRRLAKGLLGK